MVVDACRAAVRFGDAVVALESRPVLFALIRTLAECWPGDAWRENLLKRAFRARQADESHRARLRVEIGRLRKALRDVATIDATPDGIALTPLQARDVVVLAHIGEDEHVLSLILILRAHE